MILKDMFTINSKKRQIVRTLREKIGASEGRVGKGGWNIGELDCSEVSIPPEFKGMVRENWVVEGEVSNRAIFETINCVCDNQRTQ